MQAVVLGSTKRSSQVTATPGAGYVLISVNQAPLAGTSYTAPKAGTCNNRRCQRIGDSPALFQGVFQDPDW